MSLTVNGEFAYTHSIEQVGSSHMHWELGVFDPYSNKYRFIKPGINELVFDVLGYVIVFEIAILIEYQCQA